MLIFFYDMSDQTEIALDQNMASLSPSALRLRSSDSSFGVRGGGKDFNTITSK